MKTLNVQFMINSGNEQNDIKILDALKTQLKIQNKLLPKQITIMFGEE